MALLQLTISFVVYDQGTSCQQGGLPVAASRAGPRAVGATPLAVGYLPVPAALPRAWLLYHLNGLDLQVCCPLTLPVNHHTYCFASPRLTSPHLT